MLFWLTISGSAVGYVVIRCEWQCLVCLVLTHGWEGRLVNSVLTQGWEGRLVNSVLTQGWEGKLASSSLSQGQTARQDFTRLWQETDTRAGKWSRPLQMAWSLSNGISPQTMSYRRMPRLHTVNLSP